MLYKKNSEAKLSEELFKNPTAEYRGTPFWAWNSLLTKEELCRQIDIFKEMGLGGFHMHVRTGLENEYLSDEFMELVKACVDKAKKEEMLAWTYDEDRWPSGAAGGKVTENVDFRARCLLFTPFLKAEAYKSEDSCSEGGRSGNGKILACYDIILDKEGYLDSYRRISPEQDANGTKWYALLEINSESSWYNNRTYVDTLNKKAIEKFIEVTHEKYKEKVGGEFDKTIPAVFTDEPQFTRKKLLNNSFDKMDVPMPWTDSVPSLYRETYGADILDTLPEIFWDLPNSAPSVNRYRYHDFIAELFAASFADTIGDWCKRNNIALTGHMMEEPTLRSQTAALGEAMRSYRSFGIPGIDMLCNRCELTTAKQAQSAVHQYGCEGMLSELYGVTAWDCDFRTYKYQGDWQAALGVTVRVPHLSWYAMGGEAKRDYPASIHYQSPWYKKYNVIEDHFARINTALTRGKPVVKVAVVHPVESFWLHWGPNDKSAVFREGLDENFKLLAKWLLEGSIDFDYISESLLPCLCSKGTNPLRVGEMEYDAVIVPGCETLRSTTITLLSEFNNNGGRLIFAGSAPKLVDAVKSDKGEILYNASEKVDYSRAGVLTALERNRTVAIRYCDGRLTDNLIYQLRKDNDCLWLFIAHTSEPYNKHIDGGCDIKITVAGEYSVSLMNTETGVEQGTDFACANGSTIINAKIYGYDSLLYKLSAVNEVCAVKNTELKRTKRTVLCDKVPYTLSEDNVLLLDIAEYKLTGDKNFSPPEEILRLDNICRSRLGLPERGGRVCQPWAAPKKEPLSLLTLRFTFESKIAYSGAFLALENAENTQVYLNGTAADKTDCGIYTDISITKIKLPDIKPGVNELIIEAPFGENTNTENMFILGKFGVTAAGRTAYITELPKKVSFGDLTTQGFAFYGGNITYHISAEASENAALKISNYEGALISVSENGEHTGDIIYPPYELPIKPGSHRFDVTLYLHRYNTFGPLHLVNINERWHGPGAWRSEGDNRSCEYVLRKTGILKAPEITE